MSNEVNLPPHDDALPSTSVRYAVLTVLTFMSILLYLDRFAVGIASEYIREDLRMTQTQMSWFISAFFWSYALCQVPAGWFSDRFGGRLMLTAYILGWSVVTGWIGIAHSVLLVLLLRLLCGSAQAGAYPTSAGLIRHWFPISSRGSASSIVGLGGRIGAMLAPILTAWLILSFVPVGVGSSISQKDVLNAEDFVAQFGLPMDDKTPRQHFIAGFLAKLSESERNSIESAAQSAVVALNARDLENKANGQRSLEPVDRSPSDQKLDLEGLKEITEALSERMSDETLVDYDSRPIRLSPEGKRLLDRRRHGERLTDAETARLNRLAIEVLFPKEIRKIHGLGWRPVMVTYGIVGLIVALAFGMITRCSPTEHPWCNERERSLINDEATRAAKMLEPKNPKFPFRAFLTNVSLWGVSSTQFLTNAGWLFIVTWLPRYLEDVHKVPLVSNGIMTALPSGIGVCGLFAGGRATDWATRRFGLKKGRQLPIVFSRFTAAGGYGICLGLSAVFSPSEANWWLPWMYVIGLCIASMSTDFGTAAVWSFAQDVGGKYTASIHGWANMWGNLGAAIAPLAYNKFLGEHPRIADWNSVFALCCGVFVLAGFCAMLMDATQPLTVERHDVSPDADLT